MARIILALCLLISSVVSAQPGYTNINSRYKWIAGGFDSSLILPRYNGVPSGLRSAWNTDGQLAADTANNHLYVYSGGAWVRIANYSDVGSTYTFPYSVVAPGNAIQMKNDTTASAPISVYYGTNSLGRFGYYPQSGITGVNFYNSDGTLSGNRTVTGANFNLLFSGINGFTAEGNTISLQGGNQFLHIVGDTANFDKRVSYSTDIDHNAFTDHTLVDKDYVDNAVYPFDATVSFSVNADPNTVGTTFNPNTPQLDTKVYVSTIDGSLWTWNGVAYVIYNSVNWGIFGNAGTDPTTNFIGTTDSKGLLFKTANIQSGYIDIINNNTSFGVSSLASNTTGSFNSAFGGSSLTANVSGVNNTAIGNTAMYQNSSGSYNTAIGEQSLFYNLDSSNNIAIGYKAGYNAEDLSKRLYINSLDRTNILGDTTKSIIYGAQDATAANQRLYLNSQVYAPYLSTGVGTKAVRYDEATGQFLVADTTSGGGITNANNGLVKNSSGVVGLDSAGVNPLTRDVLIDGGGFGFGINNLTTFYSNTLGGQFFSLYDGDVGVNPNFTTEIVSGNTTSTFNVMAGDILSPVGTPKPLQSLRKLGSNITSIVSNPTSGNTSVMGINERLAAIGADTILLQSGTSAIIDITDKKISIGSDTLIVPNLPYTLSTTGKKIMIRDTASGDVWNIDPALIGGGGTPAGNYGNVQLNRNGAFATPASDTLGYTTAAGLVVKNGASIDGAVVINDSGGDKDFRVEGDTDTELIFADASRDNVNIGGAGYNSTKLYVKGKSTSALDYAFYAENSSSQNLFNITNSGIITIGKSTATTSQSMNSYGLSSFNAGTPTARVHIGVGTSTAGTAPLKFTSGTDLTTAEAGAMEYTTPKLTFTNDGLIRQEIPLIQQSRVSTQYDNSTTTLGNVTGLTANVAAGKTYRFEAKLYTTSNVAGGIKTAIAGTATATNIIYEGLTTDAGVTTQSRATALATSVGAVTAVTAAYVLVTGTITVNAAGTITVQAAANVATGTTSVLVGSTFVLTEML